MESTSATLLERVKDPRDDDAWREFFRLYFPILRECAGRCGLRPPEAEEVARGCMKTLAGRMRGFRYSRDRGRFKNFLRAMVNNQVANQHRRRYARQAHTGELENLPSPEASLRAWEQVWLREHLAYSIERLESRCSSNTVKAFRLYALEDWPVEKVCQTLGMNENQVYQAKNRMIRRLRQELARLVGEVL